MSTILSWSTLAAIIAFVAQQIFKTYLNYKKYKEKVVFSKLHQERAEVVKLIYQKLTILYQTLYDFTRAVQIMSENENYEEHQLKLNQSFNEAYVDARNYISLNKIYLSNVLCNKIENLISKIRNSAFDYDCSDKDIKEYIKMNNNTLIKENRQRCRDIRDTVEVEMQGLLNELYFEFRALLGVK